MGSYVDETMAYFLKGEAEKFREQVFNDLAHYGWRCTWLQDNVFYVTNELTQIIFNVSAYRSRFRTDEIKSTMYLKLPGDHVFATIINFHRLWHVLTLQKADTRGLDEKQKQSLPIKDLKRSPQFVLEWIKFHQILEFVNHSGESYSTWIKKWDQAIEDFALDLIDVKDLVVNLQAPCTGPSLARLSGLLNTVIHKVAHSLRG